MLLRLILIFTLVPLIELALLLEIGKRIGVWPTLGLVIVTGIVGATLARAQGFGVLRRIREDMAMGIPPTEQLFDGVLILAGGLLLLTPGFLTDSLGLIALIPPTRDGFKRWLRKKVKSKIETGQVRFGSFRTRR